MMLNNSFRHIHYRHQLAVIILLVVTAILFFNTFKGEFVYDDLEVVINNPEITQWSFWQGWGFVGRFTRSLSLMLDYKVFGESPYGYHFQNILWHSLSSILLYCLFSKLTKDWVVSLMGALFFAVHPIHVESVANISNRKDLLCMFFSLLSFLFYIVFVEGGKNRKIVWLVFSLLAWFLALNSKEVAIVLPLLIMSYEFVFLPKERRWLLKRPVLLMSFLAVGAVATLIYVFSVVDFSKMNNIGTLGGHRGEVTYFSVVFTSARAFWYYIELLLFPFNLSPDYIIELSTSFADLSLIVLWCLKLLLAISPFYLFRKNPLVAFGLLWFVINYIPVSNIVPLTYIVADRYMYIPSAGFCLVMAVFCASLHRGFAYKGKKVVLTWVVAALVVLMFIAYSITTILYNSVWTNGASLWTHAVKVTPMSYKSHNNLGKIYTELGDFREAVTLFNKSLALSPYPKTYVNRGNAFYYAGDYQKAIADYSMAIEIAPLLAEAYYGLGTACNALGEYDRALKTLNKAIDLNPELVQAYNNLGNVHNKLGEFKQALDNYNKAIKLNPAYVNAYNNRAYTYMTLGDYSLAIKDYEKVVNLGSGSGTTYYNLGLIYSKIEDNEKSFYFYKKAANLGKKRAKLKLDILKKND